MSQRFTTKRSATKRVLAALALGAIVFTACGTDDADETQDPQTAPTAAQTGGDTPLAPGDGDADGTILAGMGPGVSVADALASSPDQPILVNGFVFVGADGTVTLADSMAESFPPQPSGAKVTVEGLDVQQLPLTEGPSDVEIAITAWTDVPVQLIGQMVDGVFVGNSVASA